MKNGFTKKSIDIWGGIECSLNRVNDQYMDQLKLSGHYLRKEDISLFADLGIKMMRYPVLWEKHCPNSNDPINWSFSQERLTELQQLNIQPIAGLVHHGSGPSYTSFYDGSFSTGLAVFARQVAEKFPWIEHYTPINEPLTTARFCGLYGHWYPHHYSEKQFLNILLEECKATVLAMQAIRTINPAAKLVQTEDLGKTHSTPRLKYQADFENERRWLSFDLLCGTVNNTHPLYHHLLYAGIEANDLHFFLDNPCPPDIMGINHYVTSERYLDQRLKKYPQHTWGGNGRDRYADVETVRVESAKLAGPGNLLKEAWDRFHLPVAITEVHLNCTREDQLRWFKHVYDSALKAKQKGVDVRGITAWAMLGSFDWCSLLTRIEGRYEVGLFDVKASTPRATALARLVKGYATAPPYTHPVLSEQGWWNRPARIIYPSGNNRRHHPTTSSSAATSPLLIIGKTGALGQAFDRICSHRSIHHILQGTAEINVCDLNAIEQTIKVLKPWAVINAAGYHGIDEAENNADACFNLNSIAPKLLAIACNKFNIKLVTFSSDLVFDGEKRNPYLESDAVGPLNIFGKSKARAEEDVVAENSDALIIRTGEFFSPWTDNNFVINTLRSLKNKQECAVPYDVSVSPTYIPDLVHNTLDLLLDDEKGIWNITNKGEVSWANLATNVAERCGFPAKSFRAVSIMEMALKAPRPFYSVLNTEKGLEMPTLDSALDRFFHEQELMTL